MIAVKGRYQDQAIKLYESPGLPEGTEVRVQIEPLRHVTRAHVEDPGYQQGMQQALEEMGQGFHMGGRLWKTRDELHER